GVHPLLAAEVLVDHGLGDLGADGDLLDARALEALLGEEGAADVQQLLTALAGGHPRTGGARSVTGHGPIMRCAAVRAASAVGRIWRCVAAAARAALVSRQRAGIWGLGVRVRLLGAEPWVLGAGPRGRATAALPARRSGRPSPPRGQRPPPGRP